jgi:hypothetical protein
LEHVKAAEDYVDHLQEELADPEELMLAFRRFLVLEAAYKRQNRYATALRE